MPMMIDKAIAIATDAQAVVVQYRRLDRGCGEPGAEASRDPPPRSPSGLPCSRVRRHRRRA
jgi:hypothetical protein